MGFGGGGGSSQPVDPPKPEAPPAAHVTAKRTYRPPSTITTGRRAKTDVGLSEDGEKLGG